MQARAGAEWALTALVARYQPPVTRYLTRLTGNAEVARALAEGVFLRMERRLHGPEGGRHLRLWLLRASTEAGLDALRQPMMSKTTPQLGGPRPLALLTGTGGGAAMQRLKARLGALAKATEQTRRQVRKLIWSSAAPGAVATPVFEANSPGAGHAPQPTADTEEVADGTDPREALRYRMVRAVLAELPYGDAQCVALHLVAGLNQAEVAAALGLTNSATRRRIVQGLQLFAQRFNAAAASLGIAPEMLLEGEADLQEPDIAGYAAAPKQPAVSGTPPHATVEASTEATVEMLPGDEAHAAPVVEADVVAVAIPAIVEASPAHVERDREPAEPQWPDTAMPDLSPETAAPAVEDASPVPAGAAGESHPVDARPAIPGSGPDDGEETTLPAAHFAAAMGWGAADHEAALPGAGAAPDGPALAAQDAVTGAGDDTAPPDAAPTARLVPVVTPGAPASGGAGGAPDGAPGAAPAAAVRVVPVLTPQARQRVDTIPRRGASRDGAAMWHGTGLSAWTSE